MAQNKIEIDVVLNSQKAEQGLQTLQKDSKAVGESFGNLGKAVASAGTEASKGLGQIGESAGDVVSSMSALSSAVTTTGASFSAIAGPVGVAFLAIQQLIQAFNDYSRTANQAQIRVEAYKASVTELTSAVEELASAGVQLNTQQVAELKTLSMQAKVRLELAQGIREANAERVEELHNLDKTIKESQRVLSLLEDQAKHRRGITSLAIEGTRASYKLMVAQHKREKITKRLEAAEQRALDLTVEGAKRFAAFEKRKQELLKNSPEFRKKIAEQEAKLLEDARLAGLEREKETVKGQIEIAKVGSQRRIRELKAIEDISESVRSQAIAAERKRLEAEITKIRKDASEKRRAELDQQRQREAAAAKLQAAKELALERQKQAELKQIRQLELAQMQIDGVAAAELLRLRYEDEVEAAGENVRQRLIAEMRYQNELKRLRLKEADEKLRQEKALADRLVLEEKNRLAKQTELQRQALQERSELVDKYFGGYVQGLTQAAYANIIMGKSAKEAVGETLLALGQQATVQALMATAQGIGLALLQPAASIGKFKEAAAFAASAVIATTAAKKMGATGGGAGSGGGGGGSQGSQSPSGLAQTAPAPERERAESSPMVFNVNFSGAVIYDTQRAAEQALADRITNLQNRQRRGGPMRRG